MPYAIVSLPFAIACNFLEDLNGKNGSELRALLVKP
jgi:hypothetical protein